MVIVLRRSPQANKILYYSLCVVRVPICFTSIHILPVFIFPFQPAISRTYIMYVCIDAYVQRQRDC